MKDSGETANGPGRARGNVSDDAPAHEAIPLLETEDDDDPSSFLIDLTEPEIAPPQAAPDLELIPAEPESASPEVESGVEPPRSEPDLEMQAPAPSRAAPPTDSGSSPRSTRPATESGSPPSGSAAVPGAARPAAENLPPRPTSWCKQCGVKHARGDCPGEVLAREPERHGWKAVVDSPTGKKVHGVLLAPAGDGWRARILTYPRTLWVVPGGNRTIKFLAPDPERAERQAVEFLTAHCSERGHEIVDDPALKANPEPIELEQTDMVDDVEATRRKPRSVLVRFGPEKPDRRGNTADLSEKGMFIATSEPYARGTSLRMLLELAGARIPLRGVVKWTRASAAPGRPGGMGIELIRPPAFYTQYIHRLP